MPRPFVELEEHPALLDEVRQMGSLDADAVMRLRRRWPANLVTAAVDLLRARRKAAAKFGDLADRLLADPTGVEQASSLRVARHKARRVAQAGVHTLLDLCCGIGGDTIALAEVADVIAVDHDFARAWMARHNAALATGRAPAAAAADVTTLHVDGHAFHLDPDRRQGGRRHHGYDQSQPGPAFIEHLLRTCPAGAIKLGPGVEFNDLPPGEIELIQDRGTLVQAVLWTGRLASTGDPSGQARPGGRRTATTLPAGASFTGEPGLPIPVDPPGRYLLAIEPAVERADLTGALCQQLGLASIHPALGLLTADEPVASPWLTPFELLAELPWRPARVRDWLWDHDGGIVEVKTRGGAVDPDPIQRKLRGDGHETYTLHILRLERKITCYITRRLRRSDNF